MAGQGRIDSAASDLRAGRVVVSHGRRVLVEARDGTRISCTLFGRRLEAVCGDEVRWQPADLPGTGLVVEQLPRRSALTRIDTGGRSQTVVANLSQLLVVVAAEPAPDFFIADRYLAAAEQLSLTAVLILNKAELPPADLQHSREELAVYGRLGYALFECSALASEGVAAQGAARLLAKLRGHTSLLVGQSGVGKSSLANRLLPGLEAATAELTAATAEGRHTTSVSTLHHLPGGGDLIDSPGVRDYAPGIELLADVAGGFREIVQLRGGCRFQDCRHLREPSCAIRNAVQSGAMAARRYESYRRLLRLSEELAPKPGRGPKRR